MAPRLSSIIFGPSFTYSLLWEMFWVISFLPRSQEISPRTDLNTAIECTLDRP
jgi:hypothetical protein